MKPLLNADSEAPPTLTEAPPTLTEAPSALTEQLRQLRARREELLEMIKLQEEVAELEMRLLIGEHEITVIARTAMELVSQRFKVPMHLLTGRCREAQIAWPRQVGYFLVRRLSGAPYSAIGRIFNRDHGTILAGIQTVSNRIDTEPGTDAEIQRLEQTCQLRLAAIAKARSVILNGRISQ